MKIAFIGGGNMGEAILSAVLSKHLSSDKDIIVSEILDSRRSYIKGKYGVDVVSDNLRAVKERDIVILAVKPQVLTEVMAGLQGQLKPGQLVISIIAGKSLDTISRGLAHACLIRSMPNTPAQI